MFLKKSVEEQKGKPGEGMKKGMTDIKSNIEQRLVALMSLSKLIKRRKSQIVNFSNERENILYIQQNSHKFIY